MSGGYTFLKPMLRTLREALEDQLDRTEGGPSALVHVNNTIKIQGEGLIEMSIVLRVTTEEEGPE